jgi:hypothetical protein
VTDFTEAERLAVLGILQWVHGSGYVAATREEQDRLKRESPLATAILKLSEGTA